MSAENVPDAPFAHRSAPPPSGRERAAYHEDSVTGELRANVPRALQDPAEDAEDLESLARTTSDVEDADTNSLPSEVEIPPPAWMEPGLAADLRASARWLAEEGNVAETPEERLRIHLAASEVWALLGDSMHARTSAVNAHAAAPTHALAAR